jgi:hypothetical protein
LDSESKLSTEVRFFQAAQPDAALRLVQPREPDHKYYATHRDGLLYLRTNDKAKNHRVVLHAPYISVVFFSQALCRCRSVLKSISTLSASMALNRQSSGSACPQTPHKLWRRL